jgi:hypothetical protein
MKYCQRDNPDHLLFNVDIKAIQSTVPEYLIHLHINRLHMSKELAPGRSEWKSGLDLHRLLSTLLRGSNFWRIKGMIEKEESKVSLDHFDNIKC